MIFKSPETQYEFEQIHKLNHSTFALEIPQHKPNENGVLVDKFNHINNYLIAKDADKVVGMVSYNTERPFSLDKKVKNIDELLPKAENIVEIRLLAVDKSMRGGGIVSYGLFKHLAKVLISQGYDFGIISGTVRELPLYKKIGFLPFGSLVGSEDAPYQPMYITFNQLRDDFKNDKS